MPSNSVEVPTKPVLNPIQLLIEGVGQWFNRLWEGPFLYLLPALLGLFLFKIGPIVASLVLSFTDWQIIGAWDWVGYENYEKFFNSREFGPIMWNTVYYSVATTVLSVGLGLALALLLNQPLRGISFFRGAFFMPYIMPIVPVALAWIWLFQPEFGYINYFLWQFLHIQGPGWLNSNTWALPSLVIVGVWKNLGYYGVIFLAGLQTIPTELYEVAHIDGANPWARFRHITLPLLSPTTLLVLILAIIQSFHVFGAVFIMTSGGPGNSTLVLSYAIYQSAFEFFRMGYASALAWILFAVVFILTLIQWRLQRLWVFQGY